MVLALGVVAANIVGRRAANISHYISDFIWPASKLRESSLNDAQKRFENLARQVADEIKESSETKHQDIDRLPGDQDKMTYIEALTYCELGTAVAITRREGGFDDALMHIGKARAAAAEISNE